MEMTPAIRGSISAARLALEEAQKRKMVKPRDERPVPDGPREAATYDEVY